MRGVLLRITQHNRASDPPRRDAGWSSEVDKSFGSGRGILIGCRGSGFLQGITHDNTPEGSELGRRLPDLSWDAVGGEKSLT